MKRSILIVLLALCFIMTAGCGSASSQSEGSQQSAAPETAETSPQTTSETAAETADAADESYEIYAGSWNLKVDVDSELYLMTSLMTYYGSTGIEIDQIDGASVTGSIYSISGAPSYRQAQVDFEGEIEGGKLTASYVDEGWEYSGNIELTFGGDEITASITRAETEETSLWSIPKGTFTFVRPIETETVTLSDGEKDELEQTLSLFTDDTIAPFDEGYLTDDAIIDFIGLNIGLGYIQDVGITDTGAYIEFTDTVMNELAQMYFGAEVNEHKSTDTVEYDGQGTYTVPALGGVSAYPTVQLMMKDTGNEGVYYAIADYMFDYPEEGTQLDYEYLIKLEKSGDSYIIKAIIAVESPIDFEAFNALAG